MDLGRRCVRVRHEVIVGEIREPRQSNIWKWIPARISGPWIRKISAVRGGVETPGRGAGRAAVSLSTTKVEGDPIRSAHRCTAVARDIPGQSRPWREVMQFCIGSPALREAGIARKVESDRRVGIDGASDAPIKPILAELKAATFVKLGALAVSYGQREEWFPSHSVGQSHSWRHFPNVL